MSGKPFATLEGLTIESVSGLEKGSERVVIVASGRRFTMFHYQDCCESVTVDSVIGEPDKLVGEVVLNAIEQTNRTDPIPKGEYLDSYTWTYYTIRTQSATVTIRWYGSSNGYYSESVDFEEAS